MMRVRTFSSVYFPAPGSACAFVLLVLLATPCFAAFDCTPNCGNSTNLIVVVPTITVTTTADSGAGSLREAIVTANATATEEIIDFNITGACPRVITLLNNLPKVTDHVTINGFSQPGSSANTETDTYNGTHCIVLTGGTVYGLQLAPTLGETIAVRGMGFYDFNLGLAVEGLGKALVEGNVFGTGTGLIGANGFTGCAVYVDNGAAQTRIGGDAPAQRNLISRSANAGVCMSNGGSRSIIGNFIGIARNGYGDVGNHAGISLDDSTNDEIRNNYIGYSASEGIEIFGTTTGTKVLNNFIGVSSRFNAQGNYQAGNGQRGIFLDGGQNLQVQNNEIAYNSLSGIYVNVDVKHAWITDNFIHDNDLLGIDLAPEGVNPNNTDTNGTGANSQQNYPVLTSASGTNLAGAVSGTLNSSNGLKKIEVFWNSSCDGSGNGEGRYLVGTESVFINNASGGNDGSIDFLVNVSQAGLGFNGLTGSTITATATGADGDTSEFSTCIPYLPGPIIFKNGFENP